MTMIGTKKTHQNGKKWQRLAAIERKRLTLPIRSSTSSPDQADVNSCSTSSSTAEKGHFVVYTSDWRRFVLPLAHWQKKSSDYQAMGLSHCHSTRHFWSM
ncbi:Small auxin-up RNA [Trema orientale]|uniref:Small auxin-up RNA n=1 Tax=Trema orientale TaxID=63057 RepID=A0A2P5CKL0_TREOI|nr:Small auxin-up RNA [Trema orientale]